MRYLTDLLLRSVAKIRRRESSCMLNRRRTRRRHLRCELLETRNLLAAISWDGGAGTFNWNDAANWSNDVQPGASDDVTINIAGDVTIVHSSGSVDIHSVISYESIDWSGGLLTLNANSTVYGTLNNSGTVDVQAGGLGIGNGTGSGSFSVAAGAWLVFYGSYSLTSTSIVTGAGTVGFAGGPSTVAGTYAVSGTTELGLGNDDHCVVDFSGDVHDLGTLSVRHAVVDFHANSFSVTNLNFLTQSVRAFSKQRVPSRYPVYSTGKAAPCRDPARSLSNPTGQCIYGLTKFSVSHATTFWME